jgi:serine/threonine protein kinase/sugar lactone lactonase YvrE
MSKEISQEETAPPIPPVSAFTGPIAELVGHHLLSPPTRPGLLATLERFEVLRMLGGGGMGVVLLARDSETGKEVAVKLIRPELVSDQKIVHRFVKEAGHLQKLKHPNVIPVLELSDRAEGPYFVMPYFGRGNLAQRIRPGQPLDSSTILDIALPVATGLQFAHRHGIIHRDIKPANVLLGADGKTCLADFGLARTMFNDTIIDVEHDQFEGTAPYMSPAVAAGEAEDTRCDIYAFGAVLYEMLTGEPPYAGRNSSDIRQQILAGPPKPIKLRNPEADNGFIKVAEGAMARELRNRYADMADVLADLERIKVGRLPEGPHGGVTRKIENPGVYWIATGCILAALAILLLWPSRSTKVTAPPNLSITNTQAPGPIPTVVRPAPSVTTPTVVTKPAPVAPQVQTPSWVTSVFAGQTGAAGAADGMGAEARFNAPEGIAIDRDGTVYVADTGNNTIRKITADNTVNTIAGLAGSHGSLDGKGISARFWAPFGIAVDNNQNLYVAELGNNVIRKVSPDGSVVTVAGLAGFPGRANGRGIKARFRNPCSIAVDDAGTLYVADMSNVAIRKIQSGSRVSTLAGLAGIKGRDDGLGSGAQFGNPRAVAIDRAGNILVADSTDETIRRISPGGTVDTVAGEPGLFGDIDGTARAARFSDPEGLSVDDANNIFVADTGNGQIRRISVDGIVTTCDLGKIAGGARTLQPTGVAVDSRQNLYIADPRNNVIYKAMSPSR